MAQLASLSGQHTDIMWQNQVIIRYLLEDFPDKDADTDPDPDTETCNSDLSPSHPDKMA